MKPFPSIVAGTVAALVLAPVAVSAAPTQSNSVESSPAQWSPSVSASSSAGTVSARVAAKPRMKFTIKRKKAVKRNRQYVMRIRIDTRGGPEPRGRFVVRWRDSMTHAYSFYPDPTRTRGVWRTRAWARFDQRGRTKVKVTYRADPNYRKVTRTFKVRVR